MEIEKLNTVLVTDCGSTTTKALLFQRTAGGWRQTFRGEAPTTVEEPVADVTVGALNAFTEVEELSGRKILDQSSLSQGKPPFIKSAGNPHEGIDLYLSTSSAGGGLQMMVMGLVKEMTTESAQRAALGAGAIVMDAVSADDGREDHERIEKIRHIRPDIVLITGGVDTGSRTHVIEMAELLLAAQPRPRFGETLKLPVIYAGNRDAAPEVSAILERIAQVSVVENVRPTLEQENLGPAREAIHEFFLKHVMSHSPGYGKLLEWTPVPVMPTPAAVGDMVLSYAKKTGQQVLCADIGGATTDVFSVFRGSSEPIFNRTVSANLGMSYSVANVMVEAGVENIARWLPFAIGESELRDRLRNKMIRPTTIPQAADDLFLEQAVCREALRLSLAHHRSLAVGLSGVQRQRTIGDIFTQAQNRNQLVDLMQLNLVVGSGGVLSHAPSRMQAALMMLDGFALEGLTELAVDSIFMMPHLGVFASVYPEAAAEIFLHDCLVRIGHAVAPLFPSNFTKAEIAEIVVDGQATILKLDEVSCLELEPKRQVDLVIRPLHSAVNVGAGKGQSLATKITVGECGLILDGRNRPIKFPFDQSKRCEQQQRIFHALGIQ
ncbi:MAG: glutamate mutase L [Oligoflexia bacterium]|nr:glutamate mutase L [Oligoflexia bacterium]